MSPIVADGSVRQTPDPDEPRAVCAELRKLNIEAVAISLLNSYSNPDPERRVGKILRAKLPGIALILSSDIAPVFGRLNSRQPRSAKCI